MTTSVINNLCLCLYAKEIRFRSDLTEENRTLISLEYLEKKVLIENLISFTNVVYKMRFVAIYKKRKYIEKRVKRFVSYRFIQGNTHNTYFIVPHITCI